MAAPIGVIGAGVIGLACAWELSHAGADVVVLDASTVGNGVSYGNAGWVCPSLSSPLASPGTVKEGLHQMMHRERSFVLHPQLELTFLRWLWRLLKSSTAKQFEAGTAALLALNARTMELFDRYRSQGVSFEMHETGTVFAALTEAGLAPYLHLFRLLRDLGYRDRIDEIEGDLTQFEPALNPDAVRYAMYAASDRIVRPETLTRGLSDALRARGVEVRENDPVRRIKRRAGNWVLTGGANDLECSKVIVAAGLATVPLVCDHGLKLAMVGAGGYSVMVTGAGDPPLHALYLTEAKLAVSPFVGGVRIAGVLELGARKMTVTQWDGQKLAKNAGRYVGGSWAPLTGALSETWAGLRPATPTGLPVIGAVPGMEGLFVAAGHTMLGVTLAPATAHALTQLVLSGERPSELIPFEPRSRR